MITTLEIKRMDTNLELAKRKLEVTRSQLKASNKAAFRLAHNSLDNVLILLGFIENSIDNEANDSTRQINNWFYKLESEIALFEDCTGQLKPIVFQSDLIRTLKPEFDVIKTYIKQQVHKIALENWLSDFLTTLHIHFSGYNVAFKTFKSVLKAHLTGQVPYDSNDLSDCYDDLTDCENEFPYLIDDLFVSDIAALNYQIKYKDRTGKVCLF